MPVATGVGAWSDLVLGMPLGQLAVGMLVGAAIGLVVGATAIPARDPPTDRQRVVRATAIAVSAAGVAIGCRLRSASASRLIAAQEEGLRRRASPSVAMPTATRATATRTPTPTSGPTPVVDPSNSSPITVIAPPSVQ